jgi:hypothetical protein
MWIIEQGVRQEQAELFVKEDIDGSVLFDFDDKSEDKLLIEIGFTGGNRTKF